MDSFRLCSAARPSGSTERSALPVSGDDAAAKAEVTRFMDAVGYDAVDAAHVKELTGQATRTGRVGLFLEDFLPIDK
ncbi:hypothetical protein AB0D57_16690 [Streptomyces sp. NPDC048275]|uniref:hypothetical protein n=1 Tax=Streptomyces sp. NPDC048275 TaxID=3155629 RepID=UPI0033EC333D